MPEDLLPLPNPFTVKVTPKAAREKIIAGAPDEGVNLKIYVTCVPEDGKANEAVIKLLSKTYKIPKSRLQIIQGQTSRLKTIQILD